MTKSSPLQLNNVEDREDHSSPATKVSYKKFASNLIIVLTSCYRIEEGQFYEAHQQLRVIASRYVKQANYDAAIDLLASGAQLLLKAGQGGSGGDLCLFLVEVYNKAELKSDAGSKARILSLMRRFPAGEPTRKRFIGEAIT